MEQIYVDAISLVVGLVMGTIYGMVRRANNPSPTDI